MTSGVDHPAPPSGPVDRQTTDRARSACSCCAEGTPVRRSSRSAAMLSQFGLLGDATDGPADHFDAVVEHAVRAFQQQRGLITDGIVGPATYRALREAGWTLGDRMLALLISTPMTGDDVVALQERLLELGYDTGRPSGVFDEQTEQRAARASSATTADSRTASAGPPTLRALRQLGPQGHRRSPAPAARAGAAPPGRPPAARQADRDRPGARRPGPRRRPSRGVTEADLMWDLARRLEGRMAATGMEALLSRREDTCPDGGRAGGVRQRRRRRPRALAAHRREPQHARRRASPRSTSATARHHLDGRRGARRLDPARAAQPAPAMLDCRHAGPHLGAAAAHPDARRCGWRSAT